MSFALTLSAPAYPFYSGDVAAIEIAPTTVGLDGISYPIDLTGYRHAALPAFRDGVVQTDEPSDQLFDSQGAWWRYRFSWHHGAGQAVADLDRDGDSARYETSRGIDPWTRYELCLQPDVENVLTVNVDSPAIGSTATHLYIQTDAQTVQRSGDLVTWNTITGMAAENIVSITSDGVDAIIATTLHIYRVTPASVNAVAFTTAVPTNTYNNVVIASNKLLASDGNLLVEVKAATLDVIHTHFQSSFKWTSIFQVGSKIYVGGYAGNRSELYTLTTTDTFALAVSAEAASFFAGELLYTALSYGGSVILGTSKGIRFAALGGDGVLQYGPLIEEPGQVKAIAAEGQYVWFNWENFPDAGTGLGRLALDEFADTLQPAYATDLFTEVSSAAIEAVARFANRTVFVVNSVAAFASDPGTFVPVGYLDAGELFFGTVEDKSISEVRLRCDQLATNESVALTLTNAETGASLGSGTANTVGSVGIAVNAEGAIVNRLGARLELRGPGTSSPCVRQWRGRAYPIAPGVEEWIVPLIIQSRVTIGISEGQVVSMNPWEHATRLIEKWRTREVMLYQEGQHAFRVRIDRFEIQAVDWRDDHDWFEITFVVRLLSA